MKELEISIEKAKIDGNILFEPVLSGKKSIRKVTIKNKLNHDLEIGLTISGDINQKELFVIPSEQEYKFDIEIFPSKSIMKPLKAKMEIELSYVIK